MARITKLLTMLKNGFYRTSPIRSINTQIFWWYLLLFGKTVNLLKKVFKIIGVDTGSDA